MGTIGTTARVLSPIVVLGVVLAAAPARAEHCGAYVTTPGQAALAVALGLAFPPDEPGDPARPGPAPGLPCDGPNCSRAPAPAPHPTPTDRPAVEQWTIAAPGIPLQEPVDIPRTTSESRHLLDRPIGGIFHPPRPA